MTTKEEYRTYFLKWKKYIRYAPILDDLGIPKANFSQFVSGSNNNALSPQKLELIKDEIKRVFGEINQEDK